MATAPQLAGVVDAQHLGEPGAAAPGPGRGGIGRSAHARLSPGAPAAPQTALRPASASETSAFQPAIDRPRNTQARLVAGGRARPWRRAAGRRMPCGAHRAPVLAQVVGARPPLPLGPGVEAGEVGAVERRPAPERPARRAETRALGAARCASEGQRRRSPAARPSRPRAAAGRGAGRQVAEGLEAVGDRQHRRRGDERAEPASGRRMEAMQGASSPAAMTAKQRLSPRPSGERWRRPAATSAAPRPEPRWRVDERGLAAGVLQQGRLQEEAPAAGDDRGADEDREVEARQAGGDGHQLVGDRRQALDQDDRQRPTGRTRRGSPPGLARGRRGPGSVRPAGARKKPMA